VGSSRVERRKSLDKAERSVRYLQAVFGGIEVRQITTSEYSDPISLVMMYSLRRSATFYKIKTISRLKF